jgi:hypothetical protein
MSGIYRYRLRGLLPDPLFRVSPDCTHKLNLLEFEVSKS